MVGAVKYRMTFKCSCGNVFRKITTNINLMSASCPECKKKRKMARFQRPGDGPVTNEDLLAEKVAEKLRATPEWQASYMAKALSPTSPESKNINKAIDATADIVMQDYKIGDLPSTVKMGEPMAPKLDPRRQALADGMFSRKGSANFSPRNMGAIAKTAMSGGLRDPRTYRDPVGMIKPQYKPNVNIVAGDGVKA